MKFELPGCLTLTHLDGVVAMGQWFTAGHIETGGDESVTHVPLGEKIHRKARSSLLEAGFRLRFCSKGG